MDIKSKLLELEMKSAPVRSNGFLLTRKSTIVISGSRVTAESRTNSGSSGKGFTTLWYVNGRRVAKANLISEIEGASA